MKNCFYCKFFVNYDSSKKQAVCEEKGIKVKRSQKACDKFIKFSGLKLDNDDRVRVGHVFEIS